MAQYACRKCKSPLQPSNGTVSIQENRNDHKEKTIRIRCPHCGTENIFTEPPQ
jgi:DNA-directed RNA polymerase subunit RPC12/RpoP